jgi:hypothetical protein
MPVPLILRQKLFETKKRLSDPFLSVQNIWCLAMACLFSCVIFSARLITHTGEWGIILMDIPVVSEPLADHRLNHFRETTSTSITSHTSVLALTPTELIFGDVSSFTSLKNDKRNKYAVSHINGSPQINSAMEQLGKWREDRRRKLGIRSDDIIILLPDASVPVAIVSVVADKIRRTNAFSRIVMGGGLL